MKAWEYPIEGRPVEERMGKTYEGLTVPIKDTRYLLSIILEGKWSGPMRGHEGWLPAVLEPGHYQKAEGRAVR